MMHLKCQVFLIALLAICFSSTEGHRYRKFSKCGLLTSNVTMFAQNDLSCARACDRESLCRGWSYRGVEKTCSLTLVTIDEDSDIPVEPHGSQMSCYIRHQPPSVPLYDDTSTVSPSTTISKDESSNGQDGHHNDHHVTTTTSFTTTLSSMTSIPTSPQSTTTSIPTSPQTTTTSIPTSQQTTTTSIPTTAQTTTTSIPTTAQTTTTSIPTSPQTTTSIPTTAQTTTTSIPTSPQTTTIPTSPQSTTTSIPTLQQTTTSIPTTAQTTTTSIPTTSQTTTTSIPTSPQTTTTSIPTTAQTTTTSIPTSPQTTTTSIPTTAQTTTIPTSPQSTTTSITTSPHNTTSNPTLPQSTIPTVFQGCEDGWVLVGVRCVKAIFDDLYWPEAQNRCEALGANLVHIYNPSDLPTLFLLVQNSSTMEPCCFWTGINDIDLEGDLIGINGQLVSEAVLNLTMPNTNVSDCIFVAFGIELHPYVCSTVPLQSICEKYISNIPVKRILPIPVNSTTAEPITSPLNTTASSLSGCEDDWTLLGSRCVMVIFEDLYWQAAQNRCEEIGANLVHIYDPAEIVSLNILRQNSSALHTCCYWTGINDLDIEGNLTGADGQSVSEAVLNVTVPSNTNETHCVYAVDNVLRVYFCEDNEPLEGICEKKTSASLPFMTSTTATTSSPTLSTITANETGCDDDWTLFGTRCVKVIFENLYWQAAQNRCEEFGANLVHIYDPTEIANLNILRENSTSIHACCYWTGINDIDIEGTPVGVAGQEVSNAVNSTIISNSDGNDCVYGYSSILRYYYCTQMEQLEAICEK